MEDKILIIIVRERRKEKYPAIKMIIPRRGGGRGKVGTQKVSRRTSYSLCLEWNNKGAALTLKGKLPFVLPLFSLGFYLCISENRVSTPLPPSDRSWLGHGFAKTSEWLLAMQKLSVLI